MLMLSNRCKHHCIRLIAAFNWYLNDRKPFLWVVLVPGTIDIASAGLPCNLVALLFQIAESLGVRFVKTLVRTNMFHSEGFGYSRQTLKLDDGTVLAHLLHLFAIFDVDIRWCIFLVMLYSKAIA